MTASASDTLKYAESFEGYNYSRMASAGMTGGHPTLWCADFVAFVLKKKGVKSGLGSSSQQFKSLEGYHSASNYKPKKGDVFVLTGNNSVSAGHTGFVLNVGSNGFNTIEGNSGGKVKKGYYSFALKSLNGFWTPPYGDKAEKEITSTVIEKTVGAAGVAKRYVTVSDRTEFKYELFLQKGTNIYMPSTLDGINLELGEWGTPGKISFSVLKDDILNFSEGSTVIFKVNGYGVFYGYVFGKDREDNNVIKVTAYDQLRYFKNQETYIYKNKKASELFKMIIEDFKLRAGNITDTGYVIAKRIEDNKTLYDIMGEALKLTEENSNKKFYIYDNFGYLDLRSSDEFASNLLLDENSIIDFSYGSSIENTYNKIQIYKDTETGAREKYIYQDGTTISAWGVLQKTEKLSDDESPDKKGKALLDINNRITRTLDVTTFGNYYIRPGHRVHVNLDVGDFIINGIMTVKTVSHDFTEDEYTMKLKLTGGLIND